MITHILGRRGVFSKIQKVIYPKHPISITGGEK